MGNRVYPSASRLRLYTHVTRRLAGAPVRGAGRCATPATCGAHTTHDHKRESQTQIRGVPRWRDRFVEYGIKVSFWGSGTLKIVIYVENYP